VFPGRWEEVENDFEEVPSHFQEVPCHFEGMPGLAFSDGEQEGRAPPSAMLSLAGPPRRPPGGIELERAE
jgi:hypothetical protein